MYPRSSACILKRGEGEQRVSSFHLLLRKNSIPILAAVPKSVAQFVDAQWIEK